MVFVIVLPRNDQRDGEGKIWCKLILLVLQRGWSSIRHSRKKWISTRAPTGYELFIAFFSHTNLSSASSLQAKYIVKVNGQAYQDLVTFLNVVFPRTPGKRGWQDCIGLQPVTHPRTGQFAWVCERHRSAYLKRAASTVTAGSHVPHGPTKG